MKRFSVKKKIKLKPTAFTVIAFAVFIAIFAIAIKTVRTGNTQRQDDILRSALERDIMHCYALEGYYPPSLQYIEDNYGLVYDKSAYIIDYRPIGGNIYPNLTIIVKGDAANE